MLYISTIINRCGYFIARGGFNDVVLHSLKTTTRNHRTMPAT